MGRFAVCQQPQAKAGGSQREDYLHKVSTQLIKQYDEVVLEDLNITGMMKHHKLALAVGEVG